jgi:hypothetical protein
MAVATYGFDALGSYILVVALATLMLLILVWQPYRSVRSINVWLASGAVGFLLGCSVPCAVMDLNGYSLTKMAATASDTRLVAAESSCGSGSSCPMSGKSMEGMASTGSESVKICPMTGKPLESASASGSESGKTCPMTGKPIDGATGSSTASTGSASGKVCPMTGKPIESTSAAGSESGKVCPMTGKPIDGMKAVAAAGAGGASGKVCPMTGKPIDGMKGMAAGAGSESGKVCPMTGKPIDGAKGMAMAGAGSESGKVCPMTGKPIAGMKGMAAGAGETNGPRPKVDLTTLVQKMALLTSGIGITLSAEQATAVNDCLKDIEKSAQLSDSDAKAKHDKLVAVLNEKQKATLEAIALPHSAVCAGHGAGSEDSCCGSSGGSCPMSHATAAKKDENQNPFQQDVAGKAVKSLREQLAAKGPAPKAETPKAEAPKAPPAKPESAKAAPPKADAPKIPAAKS